MIRWPSLHSILAALLSQLTRPTHAELAHIGSEYYRALVRARKSEERVERLAIEVDYLRAKIDGAHDTEPGPAKVPGWDWDGE